jgi:hypothetical protein
VPPRRPSGPLFASATFAALAALIAFRKTASFDAWWHLANGRAIAAARHVVDRDVFTFSFPDHAIAYQEPLTDLLWFAGFSLAGFAFFALLKLLAVLGVAWSMRRAQSPAPTQRSPLAWLAVTGLLLIAVEYRFMERPLLLSQFFFPLLLAQIERTRRAVASDDSPRALVRAFAPLVAIDWLWIQLHREALLGPALLAATTLFVAVAFALRRVPTLAPLWGAPPSARVVLAWLACTVASVAADMVNPCGLATLTTAIHLRADPLFTKLIVEWSPLDLATLVTQFPVAVALVAFALVGVPVRLALALASRRRDRAPVDAWHFALVTALSYESFHAARWVPLAATAAALVDLLLVSEWAAPRSLPRPLPVLVAVGLCVWALLHDRRDLGLGEARNVLPAGALAFAREHHLHDRVTGSYELSGYVEWTTDAATKVEMDGRLDALYPPPFALDVVRAAHEPAVFASRRARDGVDWVLASNRPGQTGYTFLAHDPGWMLVYLSEPAALYVRREAYPELAPLEFHVLDPADPLGSILHALPPDMLELEAEVLRVAKESPDGPMTAAMTELMLRRAGR